MAAFFTFRRWIYVPWDPPLVLHLLFYAPSLLSSLSAGAGLFAAFFFLLIIVSDVTPHGTVKAPGISLYIYVNKIMVLVAMAISTVVIWIHQYNENNKVIFCTTSFNFIQLDKFFSFFSTQDRSPFCIFHIMNEISQHPELMDTFLVWNYCHIFRKIIKSNAVNISKSTNKYYQKIIQKSGHKMDLYPAMFLTKLLQPRLC